LVAAGTDREIEAEIGAIHRLYLALVPELDPQAGLGGKLLYSGELNLQGFRLVRAANIAGAASLSASPDPDRQKLAIHEGVIDFLVTSLDEALRILKNEIRKRQGVAVGIALPPETVEREMIDRGVVPDLLFPGAEISGWTGHGVARLENATIPSGKTFLTLRLTQALASHSAQVEAMLLSALGEDDFAGRRWLSLSPRYLDLRARQFRSVLCDVEAASILVDRVGGMQRDGVRTDS
jgi:urocanate hydratase